MKHSFDLPFKIDRKSLNSIICSLKFRIADCDGVSQFSHLLLPRNHRSVGSPNIITSHHAPHPFIHFFHIRSSVVNETTFSFVQFLYHNVSNGRLGSIHSLLVWELLRGLTIPRRYRSVLLSLTPLTPSHQPPQVLSAYSW